MVESKIFCISLILPQKKDHFSGCDRTWTSPLRLPPLREASELCARRCSSRWPPSRMRCKNQEFMVMNRLLSLNENWIKEKKKLKYFEVVFSTFTAAATLTLRIRVKTNKANKKTFQSRPTACLESVLKRACNNYKRDQNYSSCIQHKVDKVSHLWPPWVGVVPPDPGCPGFRPCAIFVKEEILSFEMKRKWPNWDFFSARRILN